MADNGVSEKVIGVAYDGTGYGDDGTVWGGEILVADYRGFERAAHLKTVPMPGGEQAVREPWRMAASHLASAFGPGRLDRDDLDFLRRLDRDKWAVLSRAAASGLQSPRTSSMGRLFDAVASLVGVRDAIRYEGQAAIELEMLAHAAGGAAAEAYPFAVAEGTWPWVMDPAPVLQAVIADLSAGVPAGAIAARFHRTVAAWTVAACARIRAERGLGRAALSGGVFQNTLLLEWTCRSLQEAGFEVLTHRQVPTNDGGICLGQTMVAEAN
jgi:hydrogenase maturation protein HypF